jgi:hypothetical protein
MISPSSKKVNPHRAFVRKEVTPDRAWLANDMVSDTLSAPTHRASDKACIYTSSPLQCLPRKVRCMLSEDMQPAAGADRSADSQTITETDKLNIHIAYAVLTELLDHVYAQHHTLLEASIQSEDFATAAVAQKVCTAIQKTAEVDYKELFSACADLKTALELLQSLARAVSPYLTDKAGVNPADILSTGIAQVPLDAAAILAALKAYADSARVKRQRTS